MQACGSCRSGRSRAPSCSCPLKTPVIRASPSSTGSARNQVGGHCACTSLLSVFVCVCVHACMCVCVCTCVHMRMSSMLTCVRACVWWGGGGGGSVWGSVCVRLLYCHYCSEEPKALLCAWLLCSVGVTTLHRGVL